MHFAEKSVDLGTQDWYTSPPRASRKCLILLGFWNLRGNPSLFTKVRRIFADRSGRLANMPGVRHDVEYLRW